jgi:hypothetical protein
MIQAKQELAQLARYLIDGEPRSSQKLLRDSRQLPSTILTDMRIIYELTEEHSTLICHRRIA